MVVVIVPDGQKTGTKAVGDGVKVALFFFVDVDGVVCCRL